jgi:alanine racemase
VALVFHVDGPRWRQHLAAMVAQDPGIVPVAKGNGYGFGLELLVAECACLYSSAGVGMLAVGTYAEAPVALEGFPGDVLVMEPYRERLHGGLEHLGAPALVHTVASAADLAALAGRATRPRVVLEGLTSMNRHGMSPADLRQCAEASADVDVVGATLHLPLGEGHLHEVDRWLTSADLTTWFVSHLSDGELLTLRETHPGTTFRPRVGTRLWLGDPGALSVRAQVLDVRPVSGGDHAGYRQRRLKEGYLVVVSGGTAHGVAMEAPTAASTPRQRAIAVAEGVLEAAGRVRSPFTIDGHGTRFVEPPHMQVSLLTVPKGVAPPEVGDEIEVRVRHTTLHADAVIVS